MGIALTVQTQMVLRVLLDLEKPRYGLEIIADTGLKSGTIYPILARLEQAGWVTSGWEQIDEREVGRPRRRYYKLTPDGAVRARQQLIEVTRKLTPAKVSPSPEAAAS